MSLVPFTFNTVKLQVVTVDGKEWCRAKEVCKALEYKKGRTRDVLKKQIENKQHKYELTRRHSSSAPVNWPSDSQKYDLYISEEGLYELVFSSQQPLTKSFWKHCCNVMFPHIRQQLIDKMKEAIEEKDTRIQAIQYKNIGLQGERKDHQVERCENRIQDLIANRHVPRLGDIDTVLVAVEKNAMGAITVKILLW